MKFQPSIEATKLAKFGLVINSSLKFFIYVALSRRFRIGFLVLLTKECTTTDTSDDDELVRLKPRKKQLGGGQRVVKQ